MAKWYHPSSIVSRNVFSTRATEQEWFFIVCSGLLIALVPASKVWRSIGRQVWMPSYIFLEDAMLRNFVYWVTIYSLLVATIAPARALASAPQSSTIPPAETVGAAGYSAFIAPADLHPLLNFAIHFSAATLYDIAAEIQAPAGPYRTTLRVLSPTMTLTPDAALTAPPVPTGTPVWRMS
jgi:hypothetical protein